MDTGMINVKYVINAGITCAINHVIIVAVWLILGSILACYGKGFKYDESNM